MVLEHKKRNNTRKPLQHFSNTIESTLALSITLEVLRRTILKT
jgi:hypothetical protein